MNYKKQQNINSLVQLRIKQIDLKKNMYLTECHFPFRNNFEVFFKNLNKVVNHQKTEKLYEHGNQNPAKLPGRGCSIYQLLKLQ